MLCELKEHSERGTVLVATTDLLPGIEFLRESSPILHITNAEGTGYVQAYNAFKLLDATERMQFLSLYGYVGESIYTKLHAVSTGAVRCNDLAPEDVVEFISVAAIWRTNVFKVPFNNTSAVYPVSTRMFHSCIPNAHILYSSDLSCSCRTILPVKAGDELTIEYYPYCRFLSVEERQKQYLEHKEFICHCARCDAGVDDTRRFTCELPCPGYVQAVSHQADPDVLALAPCKTCGRIPSAATRAQMRADEVQLRDFVAEMEAWALLAGVGTWELQKCSRLLGTLSKLPVQPHLCRHAHSGPILRASMDVLHRMYSLQALSIDALVKAGLQYADWLETLHSFPSTRLVREYKDTINLALVHASNPFERERAVQYTLLARRMTLVLYGRDTDTDTRQSLDHALQTLHWRPPRPHDLTRCAYCEEVPANAALTLRRCGRCKSAAYCSTGCQREHWKAHKSHCNEER